jgi:phosphoglycolate phosphatase-like HAD superfamily hydrolase
LTSILKYQTFVFDCDGVLLDSNRVKTEAFWTVASQFGGSAADELVAHHLKNGGVSRYKKFEYLLTQVLHQDISTEIIERLSREYGNCVEEDLLNCELAPGLELLRKKTKDSTWMVASGGDQAQLRRVFANRRLENFFDGGIFGSPTPKNEILLSKIQRGSIQRPALYIGDSRFDHVAALQAGLDFVFLYGWSEFADWEEYCKVHKIRCFANLEKLSNFLIPAGSGFT